MWWSKSEWDVLILVKLSTNIAAWGESNNFEVIYETNLYWSWNSWMHRCPKQTFDIQDHVTKKVKPCGKGSNKFKFDIKLKLKKIIYAYT